MKDLYAEYGRLMVEAEMLQSKINAVKRQIAEEMKNAQPKG